MTTTALWLTFWATLYAATNGCWLNRKRQVCVTKAGVAKQNSSTRHAWVIRSRSQTTTNVQQDKNRTAKCQTPLHCTDAGYGRVVQHHQQTRYNNSTTCSITNSPPADKNLPNSNILTCRDVGMWQICCTTSCTIVVSLSVGGVKYHMSIAGVRLVEFGTNGVTKSAVVLQRKQAVWLQATLRIKWFKIFIGRMNFILQHNISHDKLFRHKTNKTSLFWHWRNAQLTNQWNSHTFYTNTRCSENYFLSQINLFTAYRVAQNVSHKAVVVITPSNIDDFFNFFTCLEKN